MEVYLNGSQACMVINGLVVSLFVKAITQSLKCLIAKIDKLNKLPSSSDKQQKLSQVLNEQYSLPQVFVVGKIT